MNLLFGQTAKQLDRYDHIVNTLGYKLPEISIGIKETFVVNADDFIKLNIQPFWGQRAKDEIHINTIASGIRVSNILYHPIILAHIIPKREFYIMDGQHRYHALGTLSPTQRKMIKVQVDVLNFETEDTKWILQNYEYINTAKAFSKPELDTEKNVSLLVDECSKKFGKLGGSYYLIDEFVNRNRHNSRLVKSQLKEALLKVNDRLSDDALEKILAYNQKCCENNETIFKGLGVGKRVKQECKERNFWLGVNFPQWILEVF